MTCFTAAEIPSPWSDSFRLLLLLSSTALTWQWVRVFSMWRNLFWWPAYVSRLRHVLHVRHCNRLKVATSFLSISIFFLIVSWLFIHIPFSFPFKYRSIAFSRVPDEVPIGDVQLSAGCNLWWRHLPARTSSWTNACWNCRHRPESKIPNNSANSPI